MSFGYDLDHCQFLINNGDQEALGASLGRTRIATDWTYFSVDIETSNFLGLL